jgi:hypothetical protein
MLLALTPRYTVSLGSDGKTSASPDRRIQYDKNTGSPPGQPRSQAATWYVSGVWLIRGGGRTSTLSSRRRSLRVRASSTSDVATADWLTAWPSLASTCPEWIRRRGRRLTMAGLARPTLRCLRKDLALAVPRVDTPLEEISHPLLAKATERFADDQTPHETDRRY